MGYEHTGNFVPILLLKGTLHFHSKIENSSVRKCVLLYSFLQFITRRRPPGWSPLRNILYDVPSPSQSPTPTTTPPTKASAKEESSEEDTTVSKPSISPDVAAEPVIDSPFYCPSKPWKSFNPADLALPAAPTMAAPEEAATLPSPDGTFRDSDLAA